MARSCLIPLLGLSLFLPGVLGFHVHEDGTCHAHPFDEHDGYEGDNAFLPAADQRHAPSGAGAVLVWLAGDATPAWPFQDLTVPDAASPWWARAPDLPDAPATAARPLGPPSLPLFLARRHLLI